MSTTIVPDSALPTNAERPARGAWVALALLLSINLFNYVDRQVLAAVEPQIEKTFHRSEAAMGSLATAFLLSYMLISPIFGRLADRMSRWLLVAIGVILWSLASGGSGLAQTFVALLITRCFVGVGEAAYGPVAPTILSDLYPVSVRGKVLAAFYLAIPVGSALGYVLGGKIGGTYGWRAAFYAVVIPGMALGIWCLFMKDPRGKIVRSAPAGSSGGFKPGQTLEYASGASHRNVWRDYAAILANRSYLLDTLGMTAMTFAIGGIGFWMPKYIVEYRHYSDLAHVNGLFGAITVVSGLLATIAGGIAGDALRSKFSGSYFLVSAAGLLCGFPFFVAMLYVPFPTAWIFIFLSVFCLFFNTGPSNTILANVTHPSIRASAFALNIFIIHAFGDAVSPPVIGWLSDRYSMNIAFLFVSVMMVVGGLFWLAGARHLERDTEAATAAPG
jgi:MFS transporter, Spinster family, sphingosine-1-phosphate transporter